MEESEEFNFENFYKTLIEKQNESFLSRIKNLEGTVGILENAKNKEKAKLAVAKTKELISLFNEVVKLANEQSKIQFKLMGLGKEITKIEKELNKLLEESNK